MPDLVGGVGTFEGDPDEPVWVTVGSIIAGCGDGDQDVPPFLLSVVGDACPGIYTSKLQVLQMSQNAYALITGNYEQISPCTWLEYFAPLAFKNDFNIQSPGVDNGTGAYQYTALWLRDTRVRTFANPDNNCMEAARIPDTWITYGPKPIEVSAHPSTPYCDFEDGVGKVLAGGGQLFAHNFFASYIFPGSLQVVYLGQVDQNSTPTQILNGDVSMPIPPIPPGYSAPPSAPPLQGGAIVEALSDDDCATIVHRGGGFRSLNDIATYADGSSWEEFDDYCVRMLVPNERNLQYFVDLLSEVDDDVWNEILMHVEITYGPLSLEAVQNAYDSASEDVKKLWLRNNLGGYNLFDIWQALALGGNETIVRETSKIILKEVADAPLLVPSVVITDAIETSVMTAELGAGGEVFLALQLAESEMKNKVVTSLVQVADCEKNMSYSVISLDDSFGVPGAPGYIERNNLSFYQWMANILMMLTRCCNPCIEQHEQDPVLENFWGDQTGNTPIRRALSTSDYTLVNRIEIAVIDNLFPKKYEFGPPDMQLLAKLCWVNSDGEYGPVHFVNMDHQTFEPDIERPAGIFLHCYTGVTLSVQRFTRKTGDPPHNYYDGNFNAPLLP